MKFLFTKKTVAALIATTAFSVAANATTIDLSKDHIAQGNFTYQYTFTIDTGYIGTIEGLLASTYLKNGSGTGLTGVNITDVLLSSGSLTEIPDEFYTVTGANTGVTDSYKFNGTLAAGSYTLSVLGSAYSANTNINKFTGALSIATSAVPEPQTTSMIALGLGLIGLISMRKKQQ